jgi:(1->4)-alpha-D-glucan 1-alpha-D-glucosylmutase
MRTPASTYRLQIRPGFTLHDAAGLVPYLADLGVDWLYLSPLLTAETGSDHGYDVTDLSAVDPARGGRSGLEALAGAAHGAGLGVLVDIVPNHVGVRTPAQNAWWWALLEEGRQSRYAEAFDVDWDAGGGRLRIPVLGDGADELDALDVSNGELRYYEHRFPLAEGTHQPGDSAREVHDRQHYELVNWRRADAELNYRRFFGVNTLAGVRVEVPWVFDESHAEIRSWFTDGLADGLRVDHPDGLADPAGYLERLRELTGGAYVLVEKILEPGETLPPDWECEGTTGYDALADIDRLFTDPGGEPALTRSLDVEPFHRMIHGTKRDIADGILQSEVQRLTRLVLARLALASDNSGGGHGGTGADSTGADSTGAAGAKPRFDAETVADALAELLTCFPVYRSYLPGDGAGHLEEAVITAQVHRPDLAAAIDALHPLLNPRLTDPDAELTELARRFQQTSGMVMAKGVEDTAFYRYNRLTSLNEVGADPSVFAIDPITLHTRLLRRQRENPLFMTTLGTHDTKRSEDTRARISVLSEMTDEWAETLQELDALAPLGDLPFASLLWQALIGAWPLERERAHAYAEKAAREAGNSTRWTAPDAAFEERMHAAVDAAWDNPDVHALMAGLAGRIQGYGWSNSLSAKLLQLTMPGVPDVYQGTEFWDTSLVDPDNRRAVDFEARKQALVNLNFGALPAVDHTAEAKMLVVSRALKLRRDRPGLFAGYTAVRIQGPAAAHVFAFDRGAPGRPGAVAVITRLPMGLERRGGWEDTAVVLAEGDYTCALTGHGLTSRGTVPVRDILDPYPVALLVREETP